MATIVEAASPHVEQWAFSSGMTTSQRPRSSAPLKAPSETEKVPIELKQELGFGVKRDSESLLHQHYLSDEEGLSPVEHGDTLSIEDDSDDCDDIDFDEDLPELAISYEYNAKACTEALVISIKPVRPKVVDVSLSSPTEKSPSANDSMTKLDARHDSPVEPSSSFEKHVRNSMSSSHSSAKRLSSVPLMESAAEARAVSASFLPPSGSSGQPSFLDSDPFSTRSPTPRPHSSTHSRLRSLSKTISIAKLATKKPSDAARSPTTPVKTKESGSRMKLVPRGANEREPVLELPEFPGELDITVPSLQSNINGTHKHWPERTDSKPRQPKLRKRKSLVFGE